MGLGRVSRIIVRREKVGCRVKHFDSRLTRAKVVDSKIRTRDNENCTNNRDQVGRIRIMATTSYELPTGVQ